MCRHHICSPNGTSKIRNRAGGSSRTSQDTGLPQTFPCICHTSRQALLVPWHPRGLHGRTPLDWGSGQRPARAYSPYPDLYL